MIIWSTFQNGLSGGQLWERALGWFRGNRAPIHLLQGTLQFWCGQGEEKGVSRELKKSFFLLNPPLRTNHYFEQNNPVRKFVKHDQTLTILGTPNSWLRKRSGSPSCTERNSMRGRRGKFRYKIFKSSFFKINFFFIYNF